MVKLIRQAVADGANLIQQPGDAGLDEIAKHAWGKQDAPQMLPVDVRYRAQRCALWPACHLYRANNLVAPDSRP